MDRYFIKFQFAFRYNDLVEISDIPVYFIDYKNLIVSKKAANRPKDRLDIEELEKINNPTNGL